MKVSLVLTVKLAAFTFGAVFRIGGHVFRIGHRDEFLSSFSPS
jgi:hypothetical protein